RRLVSNTPMTIGGRGLAAGTALVCALVTGLAAQSSGRYSAPPESSSYAQEINRARAAVAELIKTKQIAAVAQMVLNAVIWRSGQCSPGHAA
ncbi:MAG: hypothetical protein LC753_16280, partial [Acidobacteria bacterium]|nr:hypothetical protein [Acidobacteriota bacterium]